MLSKATAHGKYLPSISRFLAFRLIARSSVYAFLLVRDEVTCQCELSPLNTLWNESYAMGPAIDAAKSAIKEATKNRTMLTPDWSA
jgi:hypothetical protein